MKYKMTREQWIKFNLNVKHESDIEHVWGSRLGMLQHIRNGGTLIDYKRPKRCSCQNDLVLAKTRNEI